MHRDCEKCLVIDRQWYITLPGKLPNSATIFTYYIKQNCTKLTFWIPLAAILVNFSWK